MPAATETFGASAANLAKAREAAAAGDDAGVATAFTEYKAVVEALEPARVEAIEELQEYAAAEATTDAHKRHKSTAEELCRNLKAPLKDSERVEHFTQMKNSVVKTKQTWQNDDCPDGLLNHLQKLSGLYHVHLELEPIRHRHYILQALVRARDAAAAGDDAGVATAVNEYKTVVEALEPARVEAIKALQEYAAEEATTDAHKKHKSTAEELCRNLKDPLKDSERGEHFTRVKNSVMKTKQKWQNEYTKLDNAIETIHQKAQAFANDLPVVNASGEPLTAAEKVSETANRKGSPAYAEFVKKIGSIETEKETMIAIVGLLNHLQTLSDLYHVHLKLEPIRHRHYIVQANQHALKALDALGGVDDFNPAVYFYKKALEELPKDSKARARVRECLGAVRWGKLAKKMKQCGQKPDKDMLRDLQVRCM